MRLRTVPAVICVMVSTGLALTPRFSSGDLVRRVGSARSGRPAVSHKPSAIVGGEFLLDTSSVLVPAPGSQNAPAIAFDGTNYLVAWEDHRSGSYDICAARVTPQGVILDPSGFMISGAPFDQRHPAIGFDGTDFLVVWQDYRRGFAYDIYGARVTQQGTVLDANGIPICTEPNEQQNPRVAFGDSNYLVVWQDNRNLPDSSDIYGARVTPMGQVLDSNGFAISTFAHAQYTPAIGFGGTNFLVAWQDMRAADSVSYIYATLVTQQGSVILPNGFLVSYTANGQFTPAMAFNGTNYLVAWQDMRGSFPPELGIYGVRVTPGGMVLDSNTIGICTASGVELVPAVGLDSANFLVVWQEGGGSSSDIHGTRVSPDGAVLDPGGIVVTAAANGQGAPAISFDGRNALAVWQDERNKPGEPDIYGVRVAPGGGVLDSSGLLITEAAREERTPAIGFNNANYLVVWDDRRGGYSDVYGTRVASGGTVLDTTEIAVSTAANDQVAPAVALGDSNYLVVWEDYRSGDLAHIYGTRVTPGGEVLDPSGIPISQATGQQDAPAIGSSGANYLVVWQDGRDTTSHIYGARVTPQGTVLDPSGIAISEVTNRQCSPVVGFDGTNYLVVWQDERRSDSTFFDIYGARVTPGGNVLDPSGIAIAKEPENQENPALAFSGANYLVVWEDYRRSIYSDIYGARVTPGGGVLDPSGIAISTAEWNQLDPALAFDGANYLVLWEDQCNSGAPDIYGTRVSQGGSVFDYGRVVQQEGVQSHLAMTRGPGGELFLVYEGWAGTIGNKTYNTDRIWGDFNPTPGQGIEELANSERRLANGGATIVRGVLFLPKMGTVPSGTVPTFGPTLLDISGRKVLDLHPGANDVSHLAPGVYFVRPASGVKREAPRVTKVVVTR
ncbi:MAG TPA: hypothetical protein VMH22_14820 [bacterium]|nr:hypothetical protein [bacterium]